MRAKRSWLAAGLVAVAGVAVILVILVSGGGGRHAARHRTSTAPTASTTSTASTASTAFTASTATTATTPSQPAGPAPVGPPAQPVPAGEELGASVNILFNSRAFSPAQIDEQLAALGATGATIARSDALWELTEPSPPVAGAHRYDWSFDDAIAGDLAAHRLQWLPIVDYSAAWDRAAGGGVHPPPASTGDYAAFAAALAERYGPGGTFWRSHPSLPATPIDTYEIWNEPDNPDFFSPRPDPARYADMYRRARDAITAVDPSARVIVGGLTDFRDFLPALVRAMPDLAGHVDGVAIHPYAQGPDGVLRRVRTARLVLRALGLGAVPVYVTEFGWTTSPPHALNWVAPARRADYIKRTLTALGRTDCAVADVVLYTWVTLERNPADREDWYGINPPGGGGSADATAFAAGLRGAGAPTPEIRVCDGS